MMDFTKLKIGDKIRRKIVTGRFWTIGKEYLVISPKNTSKTKWKVSTDDTKVTATAFAPGGWELVKRTEVWPNYL